jgi:hypothetical protein
MHVQTCAYVVKMKNQTLNSKTGVTEIQCPYIHSTRLLILLVHCVSTDETVT